MINRIFEGHLVKGKIDDWDLIKMKNCSVKDSVKTMKRKSTDWDKNIHKPHIRGLEFRIYKLSTVKNKSN